MVNSRHEMNDQFYMHLDYFASDSKNISSKFRYHNGLVDIPVKQLSIEVKR